MVMAKRRGKVHISNRGSSIGPQGGYRYVGMFLEIVARARALEVLMTTKNIEVGGLNVASLGLSPVYRD